MDEMDIEDLNPQHDNSLPDEPMLSNDEEKDLEELKTYFGQTRISYNVPPNRKARFIDRPIYRCQGGGEVVVAIVVPGTPISRNSSRSCQDSCSSNC